MLANGAYHAIFDAPARMSHALMWMQDGFLDGLGHDDGAYKGSYRPCASGERVMLKGAARIGAGLQIVDGVKAGPSGSTVHFSASGLASTDGCRLQLEMLNRSAGVHLRPVSSTPVSPPSETASTPRHPDAFVDGFYRMLSGGSSYQSRTVVVLHAGQFFGVGQMGALYRGSYAFDPVRKLTTFVGSAQFPPDVPLVTGGRVGPEGLKLPIKAEAKPHAAVTRLSFEIAGRAIDAALWFVRPL
jgi:hypothetical protein